MYHISSTQIKAARAMLGWLQDDLAEASGLSITTIRSLETGHVSPRSAREVRKAFEKSGIEFTEGDGVRRRDDQIKVYRGPDSCERFFDDILETIKEKGGDIVCLMKSQDMLIKSLGLADHNNMERLELLDQIGDINCLIAEPSASPCPITPFQFRTTSKHHIGPLSYYVYGDKQAIVLQEGRLNFSFVIFNAALVAQDYRNHFYSLWESASLLQMESSPKEHRAKIPARI